MSLVNNARDVASAIPAFNMDKIVRVFEGSFNRATDVTTVTGDFGSIYVYRIAHGFTRPLFVDLLWRISGAWTDGGCADSNGDISIGYADSTYVYVVSSLFAPASGTMQYKVIGSWIDRYDATNPLVPAFNPPQKNILFDSRANYQKIYAQNVLSFSSNSTQSVSHPLGYSPNFRVFFEALPNQVWPMFAGGASNPFRYSSSMAECLARTTTTALSVEMDFVASTCRAWYKIYLDN